MALLFDLLAGFPLAWLPPGLLLAAWLTMWMAGLRVDWRFYLSGLGLAILSVVAGGLDQMRQPPCYNAAHDSFACGIFPAGLTVGLLGATLTIAGILAVAAAGAFMAYFGVGPNGRPRPTSAIPRS